MRVRDVVVAARCSLAWGRSVRAGSSVAGSVMFAGPHARIRYGVRLRRSEWTGLRRAGVAGPADPSAGAAVRDRNAYERIYRRPFTASPTPRRNVKRRVLGLRRPVCVRVARRPRPLRPAMCAFLRQRRDVPDAKGNVPLPGTPLCVHDATSCWWWCIYRVSRSEERSRPGLRGSGLSRVYRTKYSCSVVRADRLTTRHDSAWPH